MKGAGASSVSSESAVLHKLGFNLSNNTGRIFAKCINRLRTPNAIIPAVLEIIVFFQMISVGFIPTIGCIFDASSYTKSLTTIFTLGLDISSQLGDKNTGNIAIFCIFTAFLVIWVIGYMFFVYKYKQTQTFSQTLLKFLLYFGYYVFNIFLISLSTNVGFLLRPMFYSDTQNVSSFISFLAIILFLGYFAVVNFMTRSLQSSPDINIKSKSCIWPQNMTPLLYRYFSLLLLPALFELLRGFAINAVFYAVNILIGIGGISLLWILDANIFPSGKTLMTTEYFVLAFASVISLIFEFVGGNNLYYLLAYIAAIVIFAVCSNVIANKIIRRRIDHLYLPFDDLISEIKSTSQCISYIKTGVIFNVPCLSNRTLQNWAIQRWPQDQSLILIISYVDFIWKYSYRDILDLVSVAIDIEPLSEYDGLLFYQIFSRLPTKELQLLRRLDGVKRLYDLPNTSLKHFWLAINNRQFDEVVLRCTSFQEDITHISQIFSNLIFENPSSDAIIQEFIHFCTEIQGNYALASAAMQELAMRQAANKEDTEPAKGDRESQQQFSKLSSVHSSIFLSDFSEQETVAVKAQHSIQSAVLARPLYSPTRFFVLVAILSVVSIVSVVVVYVVASQLYKAVDQKINLSGRLYNLAHTVTKILVVVIDFASHSEKDTASGRKFNETQMRNKLDGLCNELDSILSEVLTLHSYLDFSVLQKWTTIMTEAMLVSPVEEWNANVSIIFAIRLYHLKARTVGFTPVMALGTIKDPSSELIEVPNLYQAVISSIMYILQEVSDDIRSHIIPNRNIVIYTTVAVLCITLLLMFISCPIIIFYVMHEFDFILTIYASIPTKIIRRILSKETKKAANNESEPENTDSDKLRTQKKSLPFRLYHTPEIIFIYTMVAIVTVIPVIIITISFLEHNDQMVFVVNGLQLSVHIVESLGNICLSSFRSFTDFPSPYTVVEDRESAYLQAEQMLDRYVEIYFGTTDFFPSGLVNQERLSEPTCNVVVPDGGLNGTCSAFHESIYTIYTLVQMLISFDETNATVFGNLGSAWWKTYYLSTESAINTGINEFYNLFVSLSFSIKNRTELMSTVGFVIGWVFFVMDLIISYAYMSIILKQAMASLLKPIMVMPPDAIADSNFLMRFLQGDFDAASRKTSLDNKRTSNDSSTPLIDFILEGVLVMMPDGTIIASNKKYHEMMANTAEEVLGVDIRKILPANVAPLFDGLDRIKNGKTQQNVSMETILFTEDARELNVRITLVSSFDPNYKTTCAFIISDRSDLIKAQAQLRREKQNVEELLDSILPHNIAVSLLNGQNEISFEVENACVLFSDIVSFTPMCSNMTAKQIMNTLNHLFTEFDTELDKFSRVTKLKTIGDAYVCAAGIFEGDGPLEEAAKEIVTFGLRMQEIIPQVNQKLKTSMHMRIGIHTDGPLICGVLGKEKPLFEVIGSVVTLAEDLESTSLPDKIHVAKATVDLISSLKLNISERGGGITVHGITPPTYTIE